MYGETWQYNHFHRINTNIKRNIFSCKNHLQKILLILFDSKKYKNYTQLWHHHFNKSFTKLSNTVEVLTLFTFIFISTAIEILKAISGDNCIKNKILWGANERDPSF